MSPKCFISNKFQTYFLGIKKSFAQEATKKVCSVLFNCMMTKKAVQFILSALHCGEFSKTNDFVSSKQIDN